MTVQRWTGLVEASDVGGFVAAGDYFELQRERDALRTQLAAAQADAKQQPVNQMLLKALKELCGESDDPLNGWHHPLHPNNDEFKCEYCGSVHLDCTKIPHTEKCAITQARAAIAAAEQAQGAKT